ncbi:DUF6766 family protein [Cellulomonas sp. Root137]|uniref:DUF6766 family protein n=1 Tax=Cellulomonas sp. Root137 TaxID=1736459 RepID=UPI0006F271EB|nr:DUF6766 family protein [Cellulomonas sp. Root137]KQY43836.1 hypothetical protein ASD18_15895 [Cellulomonas sp. Root137]
MTALRTDLRRNSLTLFFGALFVAALVGQAISGVALFNEEQRSAGLDPIGIGEYVTTSAFAVDVTENWQSEFLQFLLFVVATVFFLQRGSPESKPLDDAGRETDQEQKVAEFSTAESPSWARVRGWRLSLYSRSLSLVMGTIFALSWLAQSVTGAVAYSEQQMHDLQDPVTWTEYLLLPDFWSRTLQNWQSEFLAVASMVVLSIYLRERGSPESKPVGTPHTATGVEG